MREERCGSCAEPPHPFSRHPSPRGEPLPLCADGGLGSVHPQLGLEIMKICLIYPNLDGTPQSLDMGVAYLATYLDERTGHKVRIVDPTFHKRQGLSFIQKQVEMFQPHVIGISVVSLYFDYARTIARHLKKVYPAPIVVGGFHAMMLPEETIAVPEFDAVCTGEGEYTLEEYLNVLETKGDLGAIKGLWFKQGGEIIKNEKREYNKDLDALPVPNYELFDDIDKYLYYLQRLYVIGTRGCPYQCSFCAESVLDKLNPGKRFRERDPVSYVGEIEQLYRRYKDRGMKAAHLYDSVFTFNDNWFRLWASEYQKRGLHRILPYSAFLKADRHNASRDKIRLLAQSGCRQVRIGIESGDDQIRQNVINKKGSQDNIAMDIIRECNQEGLIVKTYAILGIPGDTKQSMRKTFNYFKTPLVHIPLLFSYTPLPNTPLAKKVTLMHESDQAQRMYSFHYSKGARNPGVPGYFVSLMILKSYIFFGSRLAWNIILTNPLLLLHRVVSRAWRGFWYGCPLLLTLGYALIDPGFWPGLSKRIKAKANRSLGQSRGFKGADVS